MGNEYFLSTGEADRQRLTILGKLYSPNALVFLKASGLKPGMTILEVGCGAGNMACDLAEYVGPTGSVIAIDNSAYQVELAKQLANKRGISNINFHVHDVLDIDSLGISYDATYGKWVIEFLPNPEDALQAMFNSLKPGGILVYEAGDLDEKKYFSLPENPVVEKWHRIGAKINKSFNCTLHLASKNLYPAFQSLSCSNINIKVNQAILMTAEDKSVYRLAVMMCVPILLEKNIMTQSEIDEFCADLRHLEESDTVTGFFHNLMISGIK